MKEIWKDLIYQGVNYGLYFEISSTGKIKNKKTKNILKLCIGKTGYYQVYVSLGSRKNGKTFKLHKALAETFIPNPYNYPIINHIDGNKLNNSLKNLEWCTYSYNQKHASLNGLHKSIAGSDNLTSKLSNDDVIYIRENYKPRDKEFGCRALAKKFGISHQNLLKVIKYERYKNVS